MSSEVFCPGRTYDNVYFLFAHAAGYSSIVAFNPRDHAAHAFDLLRDRLITRVRRLAAERRCARAAVWGWHGPLFIHIGSAARCTYSSCGHSRDGRTCRNE